MNKQPPKFSPAACVSTSIPYMEIIHIFPRGLMQLGGQGPEEMRGVRGRAVVGSVPRQSRLLVCLVG